MSGNKTVSVVTVCYNAALSLEKTILSVLSQNYKDVELIIIDGGSTDGTVDLIKKYSSNIAYWISESDKGIYDAMNKGVLASHNDWIIFMNSGDVFCNSEVVSSVFEKLNSGVEIIHGCVVRVYPHAQVISTGVSNDNPTLVDMANNTFHHQASFINRSLFEKVGLYSTEYKLCSDWKFFFDCVVKYRVKTQFVRLNIANFVMDGVSSNNTQLYYKEQQNYLRTLYGDDILQLVNEAFFYRKFLIFRAPYRIYRNLRNQSSNKTFSKLLNYKRIIAGLLGRSVN
jgi:glycosyltransferase involved in cell wall biosynthesis